MISVERSDLLDRIGISASLLCAIHCMATPLVLVLLPTMGQWFASETVHWCIAAVVFPVAMWALISGYRKHHNVWVLILGGAGLIGMAYSLERGTTMVLSGICLATAHLLNLRACRECAKHNHKHS